MENQLLKKRITSNSDLTVGSIVDKVFLFAIPLMLTSMLQQLFNATDVAVVGKFASKEAMAAVGSNTPIVSLLVNFFVGISVGSNVLIARCIGARDSDKAKSAVRTSMAFAVAAGIFVAVLGNIIAAPVIELLGVPPEVKNYSITYLRLYFSGVPFIMLYNFEAAIFRSNGNTRTPLICLFIGGVFNVAANLFFVLVLGMDVDGVAIATVLANVISSMLLLHFLRKEDSVIHVNVAKVRINKDDLATILRIGMPAGLQSAVFSISNLCIQSGINSLGADYMAASSAAFNIEIFAFLLGENISLKPMEKTDRDKAFNCASESGLEEKIASLTKGIDTPLTNIVEDDGVDLSGGEKQKLALARALYKGAKIVVLDEPTSALDALAEQALYEKFDDMIGEKSAVYISHRLASTRFCDNVAMFADGKMIEYGTHDELMEKNGEYANMFNTQAQYYQENSDPEKNGTESGSAAGMESGVSVNE